MTETNIAGGWTPFHTDISKKELNVFKEAIKNILGVEYSPLAVASQVVAGTNYKFFCNSQVVTPEVPNNAAMVEIYKAPDQAAVVSQIHGC